MNENINNINGNNSNENNENVNLNQSNEVNNSTPNIEENNINFSLHENVEEETIKTLNQEATSTTYESETSKKTKKSKIGAGRKRILSYVLVGLLCSSIGGGTAAVATYSLMNNNTQHEVNISNLPYTEANSSKDNYTKVVSSSSSGYTIPQIVEKVAPSVVGVSTVGFPSRDAFGFGYQTPQGLGSGVIFNEEGYILTNYHVVNNAKTIKVIFNDGKEHEATLINYDETHDVAVIKLKEKVDLPGIAVFGDSEALKPGEPAVAIGNPVGKELLGSVTSGIISALDRDLDARDIKFIQTDAAISPGNSGGPLVNSKGEVIGINTEKRVGQGVEGLGFAIPINQIKPLLTDLIKPILRIGITGREVTKDISEQYKLPEGIYVSDISEFSPAERAGLQRGDVITHMDGTAVKTVEDLNKIKAKYKSGDNISMIVERNGKVVKLNITLKGLGE